MALLYELLSDEDRVWALGRFVEHWHGVRLATTHRGAFGAGRLPAVLVAVLAAVERNPQISPCNHLYAPYEEGHGLRVFASERDGAYEWAYEPGEDLQEPRVWGRWLLEGPDGPPSPGWTPEHERLPGFLLQFLLYEAVTAAPWWVQYPAARPALARLALGPLRPVLGRWRWPWPDATFHAADDAIGFTCANPYVGQGTADVTLAARDVAALDHLAGVSADGWLVRGPGGAGGPGGMTASSGGHPGRP